MRVSGQGEVPFGVSTLSDYIWGSTPKKPFQERQEYAFRSQISEALK